LEQALGNLLDNAVRYSPPGASIHLDWKRVGEQVEVTVKDNGPGIPAKEQDRIFERFYRLEKSRKRESGGTGLGLAIVRYVARLHGGTIRLESHPGKGSTFTLAIPAWKGKKA
jgi:signal transduction histidine kinase